MDGWLTGGIPATDLEYWAALGNLDRVRDALLTHPDPNVRGVGGYTALHAAAENGHLTVIRFLVAHGAASNARLDTGQTPLGLAERGGLDEAAALLKSLGAAPAQLVREGPP